MLNLPNGSGDCYCVMALDGHDPMMHSDPNLPDFFMKHISFYFSAGACLVCKAMERQFVKMGYRTVGVSHVHVYEIPQFEVPKLDKPKVAYRNASLEGDEEGEGGID